MKPAYQTFQARARRHALPVAFICAVTVLFFTPRFFSKTYSAVGQHMFATYPWVGVSAPDAGVPNRGYAQTDHAETYYPLSVFATEAWRSGELPMWLPYSFGGIPIMELGMTSLLYPPRLFLLFFFDPLRQHDLMMFLHLLVAGLAMYGLLRGWGAGAPGSVVAAVVWQFNAHNTFWLVIEQMAIVAAWTPLMLWAATRAVRRRSFKWASVTGAAVGVALYSGGTHYVHLSGWLLAAWYGSDVLRAAWSAAREKQKRTAVTYLLLPVISLVTALIVGLAYWLPLLRLLPDLARSPLPFEEQASKGESWLALLQGLSFLRRSWTISVKTDAANLAFAGLAVLVLAGIALLFNRSRHVRIAGVVLVPTLLALLGVRWWLSLFYYHVPFFNTMKLHVAYYILNFVLAVLAGFGLGELLRRGKANKRSRTVCAALVAIAALAQTGLLLRAFHSFFAFTPAQLMDYALSLRALALALLVAVIVGLGVLLSRSPDGKRWPSVRQWPALGYGAALLIAFDLLLFAWLSVPYHWAYRDWFFPETPLLTQLQNLQGEWRVLPVYHHAPYWTQPVLAGKTSAIFGLRSSHGYESLLPRRTVLLWRSVEKGGEPGAVSDMTSAYRPYFQHDHLPSALLEKLSVGLLVTPPRVEPLAAHSGRNLVGDGTLRPVYQGPDGWIYENARAPGRAFLVPQVTQVTGEQEALKMLISAEFDARQAALIEQPLAAHEAALLDAPAAQPGAEPVPAARIVRESLNEVEVATASPQAGVLVLNDMWAAGWRAAVDGAPQTVHRVNFAARGVVVPGGPHRVVFRYRPPLLLFSLAVSAVALLLLTVWVTAGLVSKMWRRAQPQKEPNLAQLA